MEAQLGRGGAPESSGSDRAGSVGQAAPKSLIYGA